MKNTYVIGDIHGNHKALVQCLERVNFNYEEDELISLGDIVDGFPDTYQCVEELLKIKNLVVVRGNHDQWMIDYIEKGEAPNIWINQGGRNTLISYDYAREIPEEHRKFFLNTVIYHVKGDTLFIHGGINSQMPSWKYQVTNQQGITFWDRQMIQRAGEMSLMMYDGKKFKTPENLKGLSTIYVGHTQTIYFSPKYGDITKPFFFQCYEDLDIINMDTGGGDPKGKLSIINLATREVTQSDKNSDLYPNVKLTRG